MERESREGAYTRGRVWLGLPGPASCQRRRQSAPGISWKGWDLGRPARRRGERRGLGHWSLGRPGLELGSRDCPNWVEEEEKADRRGQICR